MMEIFIGCLIIYCSRYIVIIWCEKSFSKELKSTNLLQDSLCEVYKEYPHQNGNIKELIQFESNKYVVFVDCVNDLDWETKDAFDDVVCSSSVQQILADIDIIQHQAGVRYFSKKTKSDLVWYLGRIVCLAFHENHDKAKELLREANRFVYNRKAEITRKWQLGISMLIYAVMLCIWGSSPSIAICENGWPIMSGEFMLYGSTGVILSVAHKTGTLYYDCGSGIWLNLLQVITKYVVGIIGAIFLISLYQTNFVFQFLHETGNQETVWLILGIVGGFSERVVPSFAEKFLLEEETK